MATTGVFDRIVCRCQRCGHVWIEENEGGELPKACRNRECRSRKWDEGNESQQLTNDDQGLIESQPKPDMKMTRALVEMQKKLQEADKEMAKVMGERDRALGKVGELEEKLESVEERAPVGRDVYAPRSRGKAPEIKDGDTLVKHLCVHGLYRGLCPDCRGW